MNRMSEPAAEICLGPADRIPAGEGRRFLVGEQRIAVFRGRDGALHALQDRCPHRGGPLSDGIFGGGRVICPYHSYQFDAATGECLTDPACRLQTYPVREAGGSVLLTVGSGE